MTKLKIHYQVILFLLLSPFFSIAQKVTSPMEHFGFNIGDDYHLADFKATDRYFKLLENESDRIKYIDIGQTEEGRTQPMLVISHPDNLRDLQKYKEISTKLARAHISEDEAKALASEGKAVVWIDGGLHSTETVGMHQLIETAYQLASRQDKETLDILRDVIILLVHANPDGQELVTDWYMQNPIPEERVLSNIPQLYQKYAGHDNNRDFFMLNLKETQNMARQLFVEWIPQIMYNHHQTAPAGAVVAGAPYRDPFNYVFDPLLMSSIDALGAAMSTRLNSENKPGYTQRGGSVFSTWYNGGLRTTTYFHNMIGLLTEIIGNPTPWEIPLVTQRLLPTSDTQNPVIPQTWHFQQSIDYSLSLNYAVLNYASKYREQLLWNIYRMGKNSIEKGRKDTWSLSPSKIAIIDSAYAKASRADSSIKKQRYMPREFLDALFNNKEARDPRAYIIPSDQKDFGTAIKFLNALIGTGIEVEHAAESFSHGGHTYPAGSYIVRTAQAFRPHILDMFEAQDHPNDFRYPGGPPIPPYDAAGWTLAYLMHVDFDRTYSDLPDSFSKLNPGELIDHTATTAIHGKYIRLPAAANDTYAFVNEALRKQIKVWREKDTGDFWIENSNPVQKIASGYRINYLSESSKPKSTSPIRKKRIALWDRYGGSMPSGWIRWISDQYHLDIEVIFPSEIDKGNLKDKYDIIILPATALPASLKVTTQPKMPKHIPGQYAEQWGRLTATTSIDRLKQFMQEGGQIVSIGNNKGIPELFDLAVANKLVDENGAELDQSIYYTPGSVLTAKVNNTLNTTKGYGESMDVYFSNNSVYTLQDPDIKPILWFENKTPLKSGWSWGEEHLENGVIAYEKAMGKGMLTVFTTDITFRAQAHGTFKLLFNQLYDYL